MRRLVLLVGLCLVVPSSAGEPIRPETVTPIGVPHSCAGFYPETEREAHVGGEVSLAFHITPAGTVASVVVTKSSGNSDLDDAAKICVRTWRYAPVTKNGAAVEAAWSADIEWKSQAAAPPSPVLVLVEKGEDCLHYPWWAKKDHIEGNAKLSYSVAPEGSVSDVVLTKSSGNADLDAGAAACVKSLKYRPHSGGDVSKTLKAEVTWSVLVHGPYQVNWRFAGSITQTEEATQQLTNGVIQCLRGASGRADFASGLLAVTGIWVQYDRGEVSSVSVLLSSGNDALDRFAVNCFKSQPADADRARLMRYVRTSKFAVVWPLYAHP